MYFLLTYLMVDHLQLLPAALVGDASPPSVLGAAPCCYCRLLSRPSDSTDPTSCTLTSLTVALVPSWKEKCFKRHLQIGLKRTALTRKPMGLKVIEVALRVSHSSLMSSNRMKPGTDIDRDTVRVWGCSREEATDDNSSRLWALRWDFAPRPGPGISPTETIIQLSSYSHKWTISAQQRDQGALIVYPGCALCSLCLPPSLAGRQRPSHLTGGLEGMGGRMETRLEGSGGFETLIWHHPYIYTLSDSQVYSVLGSQPVRPEVDQRVQCSCGACRCGGVQ
uniref:Uncharacterized protein n=1 Tax=Timema douglasi TaxID=61478 RepID=A0A7R8Z8W3_TIMDO|nr:unnamed protein product [Timema douglasi]